MTSSRGGARLSRGPLSSSRVARRDAGSQVERLDFLILLICFKKLSKSPGVLACLYLIMYSIVRIIVEHFRIDSVLNIDGIPIAQLVSLIIIVVASVAIMILTRKKSF